jgi:diphosphoinositol-polyphosphate diphosphatase
MAGLISFPSLRCIPYMLKEEDGESSCQDVLGRLQVLMISTPKRGDLIFPKVRQQN